MKKILLFIAAALFSAAMTAQVTYQPDGAMISIGGKYMTGPFLRAGDIAELVSGTITYDTTTHVLTLNSVNIEASDVWGLAIASTGMPEGSQKIDVHLVGPNYVLNKNAEMLSYGIITGGGTITFSGLRGSLDAKCNTGTAFAAGASETILKDGAVLYAGHTTGPFSSRIGVGQAPFTSGKLIVDCGRIVAYGTDYSLAINPTLIDAEISGSYTYSEDDHCFVDGSNNPVKGKDITVSPTKSLFMLVNGDEAGGSLIAKKDGKEISNPYRYVEADEAGDQIEITATANTGYAFRRWASVGASIDDNYKATTTAELPVTGNSVVIGHFNYTNHAAPERPWYILSNAYNGVHKLTDYATSEKITELTNTGITKKNLTHATYAQGRLYFIDQADGTHTTMQSALFDPETGAISDQKTVFASQDKYRKFYGLTYDIYNDQFYAAAVKSDNKEYLIRINRETGHITEIGELKNMDMSLSYINMLAVNKEGELYGNIRSYQPYYSFAIFRDGDQFCKISTTTAAWTYVGHTGDYFESESCTMAFDFMSGELITTSSNGYVPSIVSIDPATGKSTRLGSWTQYNSGMFQIIPNTAPVKMEVKSGQEYMGKAVIQETGETKGRFIAGDEFKIKAWPSSQEFRFVQWSDGNTDNPRTIIMEDVASASYTAEFDFADGVEKAPVWIGSRQLSSFSGKQDKYTLDPIVDGELWYDSETNTLTLNDVNIQHTKDEPAITIKGEDGNRAQVTINLYDNKNNVVVGTPSTLTTLYIENADVTIEGSGDLDISVLSVLTPGVGLKNAHLTFNGTDAKIDGNSGALVGSGDSELTIRGSNVTFKHSVTGLKSLTTEYCSLTTPAGAEFDAEDGAIEKNNVTVTGDIIFTSKARVHALPILNGKGSFILRSATEEFENVGWFDAGTEVTITAKPASGFEFARWEDDILWGDETKQDQWLGDTRTITTTGSDEKYKALFYYSPNSSKTWYAVRTNDNKYISFDMDQRGFGVIASSTPVPANFKAGDYHDGYLEYQDGVVLKTMPFSGIDKDEPLSGKDDIEDVIKSMSVKFSDMAYDMLNKKMYGIQGWNLYSVDYDSEPKKVDYLGTFQYENGDYIPYASAIAIDKDGTIYILCMGDPGTLYRVKEIDEEKDVVIMEPVGPEGAVDVQINSESSMAFDLSTGELFWAAKDYLRYIDTETGKSYACGDIDGTRGGQGFMKALHCMSKLVKVTVKIADDHDSWGTVSVSNAGFGAGQFIAGQKATITAKANEGYKFLYWTKGNSATEIEGASYSFSVTGNVTYWAHFKKIPQDEGIEDVQGDKVQCTKVFEDGQLYIIRDGKVYNVTGNRVK